jgi:hypothetical protein
MRTLLSVSSSLLSFSVLAPAQSANATPRPNDIAIVHVSANGTGCPQSIDTPYWTATKQGGPADYFEIVFNQFSVTKGQGIPIADSRKFCTISVDMKIPEGWSYSLFDIAWEGYGDIPRSYTGYQIASYRFPQHSNEIYARTVRRGPFSGSYQRVDRLGIHGAAWSPCGLKVPLHIKAELQLQGFDPVRQAMMTVDSVTGKLKQVWGVRWQRCR